MSSTFKNRIPKRKYRERSQPAARQSRGFLEKKQDYKQRAKNFHQKEDHINRLRTKAQLKNQDQFYFKMLRGHRNEDGKFIEVQDQDSDFDQKQYRKCLKAQNYSAVLHQRSLIMNKINKLKDTLQLLSIQKNNSRKIFVDDPETFQMQSYYKTEDNFLDMDLNAINDEDLQRMASDIPVGVLKSNYQRLAQYMEKQRKLQKLLLKIGYQKNLQNKDRCRIKKYKQNKYHKFFMQRKK